jgi:hypothetical protein
LPLSFHIVKSYVGIIVISLLLVILSFLDTIIGFSFLDSYEERSSLSVLIYLTVIVAVNLIAQYVLVLLVLRLSRSVINFRPKIITVSHISMLVSITLNAVVFISLIAGAFQTNTYESSVLIFLISYNLVVSVVIVGILTFKFLSWLRKNRNPFILLYLAAFAVSCLVITSALSILLLEVEGRPSSVTAEPNPWDRTSTRKLPISDFYRSISLVMFGTVWLATSLLLRSYAINYSKRIGKKKLWILMSLPLLYYFISSDFILNQFTTIIFEYPYLANLIVYSFGAAKQVGGVFFAISFIFMLRNASTIQLKVTLAMSASGIMILFSSIQITILQLIPYPPFGLSTLLAMPISSYLLLIGLYYSARSISQDTQLLQSLKKRIKDESSAFLGSIGSAEWQRDVENTVQGIVKKSEKQAADLDSELSVEDVKSYISQVVQEVKDHEDQVKHKGKVKDR